MKIEKLNILEWISKRYDSLEYQIKIANTIEDMKYIQGQLHELDQLRLFLNTK